MEELKKEGFEYVGEMPVRETINNPTYGIGKNYTVGSIDESMLTNDELELVAQYASEIDITDSKKVLSYGANAQRNISDFSVTILNKVRSHELGDVGASLKELTVALDTSLEPQKKGIAGLFQRGKKSIEIIKANYAKAETNVRKIERDLEEHQVVLMQDVSMLDQMYQLNLKYYRDLTMYIMAGKKALDAAREKADSIKLRAEETQLAEDVQAYNDYMALCNRFEKKIHDLELTRTITIQTAPQVRMIQSIDEEMLEKIQSSMINTIPLWRNQMVISLGIEHSRRAIEAQNAVTQKTNELLSQNATALKQATVESAREAERSIVEIETLKKCNQELISSINEVVKIHEKSALQRKQAEKDLVGLELELKQALLEAAQRR